MNYFARPYTKPTTGISRSRKQKFRILCADKGVAKDGKKIKRDGREFVLDAGGKGYAIEVSGTIRRLAVGAS